MAKAKYSENAIINDGKLPSKVWLDPSKRGSSRVVPMWEGRSNRDPKYMDIALYCMSKIEKETLKSTMQVHKHLSTKEILCLLTGGSEEVVKSYSFVMPKYAPRSDYIIAVSSEQIGYVVGYTTSGMLDKYSAAASKATLSADEKYDAALIEFETVNPVTTNLTGGRNQNKVLTMYDDNFILSKECEFIEIEEIENYMSNWEYQEECYGL